MPSRKAAKAESVADEQKSREAYLATRRAEHAAAMAKALGGGAKVASARAVNPKNPDEGVTIIFEPKEQAEITRTVAKILKARK